MSVHINELLSSKKVLLLQGPMGDFFTQLADWLDEHEIECHKINFNGGDWLYYHSRPHTHHFRKRLSEFAKWLEVLILTESIDSMVCFGDCRKYHRVANQIADRLSIRFFAFEEGYIRPNYVTFEQDGVNFFSNFTRYLKEQPESDKVHPLDEFEEVHNHYPKLVRTAFFYYLIWSLCILLYPYYRHHRGMSPLKELSCWMLSGCRRLKNYCVEEKRFNSFLVHHNKSYYVFALQVHNDFQIRVHSDLKKVESYIEKVIESFSLNAKAEHHLVLKHHPMDRGYREYTQLIQTCAQKFNVEDRVHYFCDIHLPTLLKQSLGMVTINSTTGIQALFHNIPVKVLGRALYDLPRLTHQYPLSHFWLNPGTVDKVYFSHFRHELIEYSQLNGGYYGRSPWMKQYKKVRAIELKNRAVKKIKQPIEL